MRKFQSRSIWPLCVSLLLHVVVGSFIFSKSDEQLMVTAEQITVEFVSKNKESIPIESNSKTVDAVGKGTQNSNSRESKNIRSFESLLSGVRGFYSQKPLGAEVSARRGYSGSRIIEISKDTTNIDSQFNLPLALRRFIANGKASAVLVFGGDYIEIEILNGQKDIRASLFNALISDESYRALISLFKNFGSRRIRVTVAYETKMYEVGKTEFEVSQKIFENEIEILTTRYLNKPDNGPTGIVLEDYYSRLAKRVDKRKWKGLFNSPAYKRPVMGYKLYPPE